jgi:hypothetical protein
MDSEINPYAVPQTEPAAPPQLPIRQGATRKKWAVGCAAALMISSPVAAAFATAVDIESIVISGAIFMVIALVLLGLCKRQDLRGLMLIAIVTMAMVIGCLSTIYLNHWSPGDAQVPIGRATVMFACLIQFGWLSIRSVWVADRQD